MQNLVAGKDPILKAKDLYAYFDHTAALRGINLEIFPHTVTAIIGPSGCGKSTFVRCANRLHEEVAGGHVKGDIFLEGRSIYSSDVDPVALRRKTGMVFQKPNPFPAFSIFENVAMGLKLSGIGKKHVLKERIELSLRQAALWDEVK